MSRAHRNISFAIVESFDAVLRDGAVVTVRTLETKELRNRITSITRPLERCIFLPGRRNDVFAQITETFWVIGGRNDLPWLTRYLPRAPEFSDDEGMTWHGAYGPRLRTWAGKVDQFDEWRRLLIADPTSRRAVGVLFDPDRDFIPASNDIPCNNWLSWLLRDGRLHLNVAVRSNDAMWGFSGVNSFEWSVLQEMMAFWIGADVGESTFFVTSYHVYSRHYRRARDIVSHFYGLTPYDFGIASPRFATPWADFSAAMADWFEIEEQLRADPDPLPREGLATRDPFLSSTLRLLRLRWGAERWTTGRLRSELAALPEDDFATAAYEFFGRDRPELLTNISQPNIAAFFRACQTAKSDNTAGLKAAIKHLHARKNASYAGAWKRRGERVRHPVSSSAWLVAGCGGAVQGRAVWGAIDPGSPKDAYPSSCEDADGMRMVASAGAGPLVDVGGPRGRVAGVVGEAGDGSTQAVVAGPSEDDAAGSAGGVGDGADAGLGGELVGGLEAVADVAEFGEDLGGADASGSGKGHDDLPVGQLGNGVLDAGGELGDLATQAFENGGERADHLALGLGFGFAGAAGGGGAQAVQQLGGAAAPTIGVAGQKGLHPVFAEAGGAVRGGIALHEGERDGAVDVGEGCRGAGPEAVQQAAQAVGQADALGDQIVATADQGAQRLDLVGAGRQGPEAVAVGAQDVGEHEGVAGIALAAGGAVAWPAGPDDVGVDRHDRMAGLEQGVDDQPARALDGDGNGAGRCQLGQPLAQVCQTGGIVRDPQAEHDGSGAVDDADGMAGAAPIQSPEIRHGQVLRGCATLPSVGRNCGSLIDWRSGLLSLALHPVARRALPAPAMRRVSRGPFAGKRPWPSWRVLGRGRAFHPACGVKSSTSAKVPQ
jgi:hypothetical protein